MTSFPTASTIFFDATTTDKAGQPLAPSSATLTLVFLDTSLVRQKVNISMTVTGNAASASWESEVAHPGRDVEWTIKAAGTSTVVQSGVFTLTDNPALS